MLHGILPPLPTPFTEDGVLDLEALRSNVEMLNATGLSGYVALGTNSEAVHVTPVEASQVFATVKRRCVRQSGHRRNGRLDRGDARHDASAADAGCDAALIVTPFYYKNNMTGKR
jgi:dihydrodipicolinate synthase/N-acetylneuraminate lyase